MPYNPGELGLGASTPANGSFRPGELGLPATTPGGLATGVNGERVGATNVAADGTVGQTVSPTNEGRVVIKAPKVSASADATGKALRYPKERQIDSKSDYVIFEFYDYNPPFGSPEKGEPPTVAGAFTGNPTSGYKDYNQSIVAKTPADLPSILLYMPEDIQSVYSQKWGGADFGSFAAGLLKTAGQSVNLETAVNSIDDIIKTGAFKGIQELTNKLSGSNISLNQTLGGISGTIMNPNTEMMYDGPNIRTFNLKFKLVPFSTGEAQEIRKICNTFKKAMLPSFGGQAIFGTTTATNLITVPKICQVTFMQGNSVHPYLSQYKTCAIDNVSINYTADGSYATYEDGSPVATELTVSFKEMKNIFAEEIVESGPSY